MNKFERYNASQITPQHTLLKKILALIDFLKKNPTYNVFSSSATYSSSITTYQISSLDLRGFELDIGDCVLFANSKIGFVESFGETTFTILNAIDIKGAKGDTGETGPQGPQGPQGPKGDTGEIADVYDLLNYLIGSETIVVDLNEDNTKIEFHLDADVIAKIENSLQLPISPPTEEKLVAIGINGAQKLIDIPSGSDKYYLHTITIGGLFTNTMMSTMHITIIDRQSTAFSKNQIIGILNGKYYIGEYSDADGVFGFVYLKSNGTTLEARVVGVKKPASTAEAYTFSSVRTDWELVNDVVSEL